MPTNAGGAAPVAHASVWQRAASDGHWLSAPRSAASLSRAVEKSGKTIHLLKARSKPIQSGRKKKKIATLSTFADYKESKKKPAPEE